MTTTEPPAAQPSFWAQVWEGLAPKENRVIATIAFFRTLDQSLTGSALTAAGGGFALTAAGLAGINWVVLAYAAAAVILSALLSALKAYRGVLANGLNRRYAQAVVHQIAHSEQTGDPLAPSIKAAVDAVNADALEDAKS